jgi:hypothetical protein
MRHDPTQGGMSAALPSSPAAGLGATSGGEAAIAFPRVGLPGLRARLLRPGLVLTRPVYGLVALAALITGCLAVVVFAAAEPSILVPRSRFAFPGWLAGPLHGLLRHSGLTPPTLGYAFSAVILAMMVAYAIALASVRLLSTRVIVIAVVAIHAVLLLSPPLQLTDLFNYLGYARLGALHHLNPYVHVIAGERHDPVWALTTWYNLRSPYGPAFTLLTYPMALLPLSAAYWLLKTATILASLGFIALVWRCARQLGHDPRFAVLFVAANPIFLIYELGGFHNDVFMLVLVMASISLLLDGRDRWSGAALALAIAVKFTAVLLLPFLLLAARRASRRVRVATGVVAAAVPLALASIAAFGVTIPNLSDQASLLTNFSIPNLLGLVLGQGGGTPTLVRLASVAVVVVVAALIWRRGEWLTSAGWSTLALVLSLAWLVPWYIVWVLPLAGLGTSLRLRRATLAFSVFLVLSFIPATSLIMTQLKLNPMSGAASKASLTRQQKLEH